MPSKSFSLEKQMVLIGMLITADVPVETKLKISRLLRYARPSVARACVALAAGKTDAWCKWLETEFDLDDISDPLLDLAAHLSTDFARERVEVTQRKRSFQFCAHPEEYLEQLTSLMEGLKHDLNLAADIGRLAAGSTDKTPVNSAGTG